jgi:hypothetical protein
MPSLAVHKIELPVTGITEAEQTEKKIQGSSEGSASDEGETRL